MADLTLLLNVLIESVKERQKYQIALNSIGCDVPLSVGLVSLQEKISQQDIVIDQIRERILNGHYNEGPP